GQRVQKRRFARVRVTGERDDGRLRAPSRLALGLAPALEVLEPPPKLPNAASCQSPVGLELRLARAAGPDPAAQALEVLPHPSHPRKVVLELGQLDLELALGALRMLGEDVEDELGAIDDAELQLVLEAALLARIEVVVHQQRFRIDPGQGLFQLDELPLADVRARVRRRTAPNELSDRLDSRGSEQL